MNIRQRHYLGSVPPSRGMTLVEVMIGASISMMVIGVVVGLMFISGRSIKEIYGQTRTRSARMMALDQIRYRLVNAQIGSVQISEEEHRITFRDPRFGGATSSFSFDPNTRTLFYDDVVGDTQSPMAVVTGPIDITFEVLQAGALINLKVKSASHMKYADIDEQDGETVVYLRNI